MEKKRKTRKHKSVCLLMACLMTWYAVIPSSAAEPESVQVDDSAESAAGRVSGSAEPESVQAGGTASQLTEAEELKPARDSGNEDPELEQADEALPSMEESEAQAGQEAQAALDEQEEEPVQHKRTEDGFLYEIEGQEATLYGYEGESYNVTLPRTIEGLPVTKAAPRAFEKSTKMSSVVIGSSIQAIGDHAFSQASLSSVVFEPGDTPLTVGTSAFYHTDNLQTISFGTRPITLEASVFGFGTGISQVEIPANVTLGNGTFQYCHGLREVEMASGILPDSCFRGCEFLWKVNFTGELKSIENYAFTYCSSLTDIELPQGLLKIGDNAFSQCTTLPELILPDSLTQVGKYAFSECSLLEKLVIPAQVSYLGDRFFYDCNKLRILQVDEQNQWYSTLDSVLYDKGQTLLITAARNASGDRVLPDTLKTIQAGAFYKCKKIESITLPQGLETIQANAFEECSSLQRAVVPDSVQGKLERTFGHCTALTYAQVGEGVTELDDTFIGCSQLKEVKLTENIKSLGNGCFCDCVRLENITIPSGITRLDGWDFYKCESLRQLEMPRGLTYVGFRSLQYCQSLESLTFYENLRQVSNIWWAMADNVSLQYVLFHGPYVELSDNVFANMNPNFVIFRREAYPEWEQYTHYPVVTATDAMLELKENLGNLSISSIRIADKERVEGYQAQYDALNYLEQRLYLDSELSSLRECRYKIEALEVGAKIDALPSPAKIKPEDRTVIRQVDAEYEKLGAAKQVYIKAGQKLRLNQIKQALAELLAVKGISLSSPAEKKGDGYQLVMSVKDVQKIPVVIRPDYAEDRKLDAQSDSQDSILSVKIAEEEEAVQLTAMAAGTAQVAVRHRDLFQIPLTVTVRLETPKDINVSQEGAGTVTLNWDRSAGADYYKIYRKTGQGEEAYLGETVGNVGIYVDTGLQALTSYTYRVEACQKRDGGKYNSLPSQPAQVTVDSNGAVQTPVPTGSPKPTGNPDPTGGAEPTGSPRPTGGAEPTESPKPTEGPTPGTRPSRAVIKLNYTSLTLQRGTTFTSVKVKSSTPADAVITSAESSNPSVASAKVKNKKLSITGKKNGTAYITVTGSNQASAKIKITVKKKVSAKKLTLNRKKATLKKGRKLALKATLTPVTATDKVKWTSSDKKKVSVTAKGVVKAKKKGKATITAKTPGGKKAVCKITVK